ncbi:MAG: S41 family peptidase, partial [Pseudomonadota bacterium]
MRSKSVFQSLSAVLTAGLVLLSSQSIATEPEGQLPLDDLRTFADVYNQIRIGYVEEVDDSTLLEYAIQGMLMGLDPHSSYMSKSAFSDLQEGTSGEFSGLGLEVGMEGGYITVISPIDGSPAADADLRSGDVILKLDNAPVQGMSLREAIELMRGPKGSEIELTVGRPGTSQPFTVTLIRDTIKVASVRSRWLEPGYGYIRIAQFQQDTGDDVSAQLKKLQAKGKLNGLVLDLRNNPGGVLGASVSVAGLFLDGGLVVYTEGRLPNSDIQFEAKPGDA